ncbi:hypothetical protein OUZ56_012502 [Daphnia magna]|uniref:CxC3 like cysteine cluster domain-containing protein n=1 Tax=Daphnia magna TaxID=35525 RepID=A0ABQ9Z372_9CRUS|nr:hypothetical protein OUZ56_012502 [Daphnia magna]
MQCEKCSLSPSGGRVVKCSTCKKHLCGDCDFFVHSQQPFHNRWLISNESWFSLRTMEFIDSAGKLVEKGVPVPCFKPHQCTLCDSPYLQIESGSRVVVVVTAEGRFEYKSSVFSCLGCHGKSLYGDAVIALDSDLNHFVAVLDNNQKTKKTSSESCGGSTFKAAKSYSSHRKNLDEIGVVMGCCRHGVVQRAVNMFHGETFRHKKFIHRHMAEKTLNLSPVTLYAVIGTTPKKQQ